jgi:DNA-binding transcriptional LysR family regulator
MKLSGMDANLVVALDALLKARNVTKAAARLGISQPALSHQLARLREHFNDPLLIPKGRQLVLTSKATALLEAASTATAALAEVFAPRLEFDPKAPRGFVVASSDLFAFRFMPEICRTLEREAPGVRLELRPLVARATEEILSDGVELAFGVFEDVSSSVNQEQLFSDAFVCVFRADHPRIGPTLSLEAYLELRHLEVQPAPHAELGRRVERLLSAKGKRRRVTASVPYFLLAARVLAECDLVLTMTQSFAHELTKLAPLRSVPCPVPLPSLAFSMIWPRQQDGDAAHRWLRDACARVCLRAVTD